MRRRAQPCMHVHALPRMCRTLRTAPAHVSAVSGATCLRRSASGTLRIRHWALCAPGACAHGGLDDDDGVEIRLACAPEVRIGE